MDLCARLETVIQPQSIGYIPLNVALEIPEGSSVLMAARSSLHKAGLMAANGIGIFDWDFKGDNDEYQFIAYNFTQEAVTIERGQRIAQIMAMKQEKITFEEVEKMGALDRGGIGSTGKH